MADRFEVMLKDEVGKIQETKTKPTLGNQQGKQNMVLKFDLTNASGKPPSGPIRDEKFSLDTFYSTMKLDSRQSDGSYTTT